MQNPDSSNPQIESLSNPSPRPRPSIYQLLLTSFLWILFPLIITLSISPFIPLYISLPILLGLILLGFIILIILYRSTSQWAVKISPFVDHLLDPTAEILDQCQWGAIGPTILEAHRLYKTRLWDHRSDFPFRTTRLKNVMHHPLIYPLLLLNSPMSILLSRTIPRLACAAMFKTYMSWRLRKKKTIWEYRSVPLFSLIFNLPPASYPFSLSTSPPVWDTFSISSMSFGKPSLHTFPVLQFSSSSIQNNLRDFPHWLVRESLNHSSIQSTSIFRGNVTVSNLSLPRMILCSRLLGKLMDSNHGGMWWMWRWESIAARAYMVNSFLGWQPLVWSYYQYSSDLTGQVDGGP